MKFNDKLKELRKLAGLTQEGLAAAAGLPSGSIKNYEQGARLPGFPVVVKLAAALGQDCRVFADCTDVADVPPPVPDRPAGKRK